MKDAYDKMEEGWIMTGMRDRERRSRREACILVLQDAGEWSEVEQLRDLVRRLTEAYSNEYGSGSCNHDLLREALAVVDAMPHPPWEQ